MLRETILSEEAEEQFSGGLMKDLLIFGSDQASIPRDERIHLVVVSYDQEIFNTMWTTWWHRQEIQSELIRLSKGVKTPVPAWAGPSYIGALNGGEVYYEHLRGCAPRVGVHAINPSAADVSELSGLIVTTAVNRGLNVERINGLIGSFVNRHR